MADDPPRTDSVCMATPKIRKVIFTFRIDPFIKEAAKRAARDAKTTLSNYLENLIRLDLWRKGLI